MTNKLINLHLNTTYSFFESCITSEEFVEAIKNDQVEYFSVTEHNNFYSLASINNLAKKNNLKPIFGLDCDVLINDEIYRYIVFAKNKEAFIDLKNLSLEILKNQHIELQKLLSYKDLILIEHPIFGYYEKTGNILNYENYYFSMQSVNLKDELINNHFDKCLLINHNCIMSYDDNEIINILAKMKNSSMFIDVFEAYSAIVVSDDQTIQSLVEKTNEFAKSLYFEIESRDYSLPKFKNDLNLSSYEYLKAILKENIVKKFNKEQ